MSSDNGTYIIELKGCFAVLHTQGIDNIFDQYDEEAGKYIPNYEAIGHYLKDAFITEDKEIAFEKAVEIEDGEWFSEYGICVISQFSDYTLQELTDGHSETKTTED